MLSFFEILLPMQAGANDGYEECLHASHPDTIVQRAIGLQQHTYRNEVLEHLVMTSAPSDLRSELVQTIPAVHKSIQAGQRAMFSGMAPIPAMWLSLNYDVPEK